MTKKIAVAVMGLLGLALGAAHGANYYNFNLANEPGLAYNTTYYVNVATTPTGQLGIARMSAQVTYSSMSPVAVTYTGGRTSTATITVVSTQAVVAAFATNKITVPATSFIIPQPSTGQITVLLNTGLGAGATSQLRVISTGTLAGAVVRVNGATSIGLLQGTNWTLVADASATAQNITTAINNVSAFTNIIASCPATPGDTIFTTSTVNGAPSLLYSITSTNGFISTNTFTGGTANAILNVAGNLLVNQTHWTVGATSSNTAVNICNAINTYLPADVVCIQTGAQTTIYTTATVAGSAFNGSVLISSPSASIKPSATTYTGGRDDVLQNATINFNGNIGVEGIIWSDDDGTSSTTAVSITNWLNSYGIITATTAADGVIWATATLANSASNAYVLSSNNANLVIANPTFTGGQDSATITINGYTMRVASYTWAPSGLFNAVGISTGSVAIQISSVIVSMPGLSTFATSTTTILNDGIVWTTSTIIGNAANYAISSSTPALRVPTSGLFFGGSNSSNTINTAVITVPNHGLSTGLQVWQSTGSAVRLAPLNWGTTYYVIVIDANNIALASSVSGAVAGSSITITSSSTLTTAPTFTLNPVTIAGTPSYKWQVSNDGLNWTDLTVPSSYTIGGYVFPSTTTVTDFSDVDYQQYRLNVVAPTAGGLKLKVQMNGRL